MKKKLFLAAAALFMALSARADNVNQCYWMVQPEAPVKDYAPRTRSLQFPAAQDLKLAPIGTSMGSFWIGLRDSNVVKCPHDIVPTLRWSYWLEGVEEVPGFNKVFKTNLPGIGFRLISDVWTPTPLPFDWSIKNGVLSAERISGFTVEFIRTAHHIQTGSLDLNFTIYSKYDDWYPMTFNVSGSTALTTREYFTGCAGAPTVTFPLGKVHVNQLVQPQTRRFNLEVVCAGAPPGAKLPVRLYFEGSNNGAGRLNLSPGGAEGVEIALSSNAVRLPFSVGGALNMDWLRTEPNGERYSMPIDAGYARIGGSDIKVGQANGTMNYVIEYN